jgi:hypothetical protein
MDKTIDVDRFNDAVEPPFTRGEVLPGRAYEEMTSRLLKQ